MKLSFAAYVSPTGCVVFEEFWSFALDIKKERRLSSTREVHKSFFEEKLMHREKLKINVEFDSWNDSGREQMLDTPYFVLVFYLKISFAYILFYCAVYCTS